MLVDASRIVFADAAGGYARLKLGDERHLVSFSLSELERRLPDHFFRAHRSCLVNLHLVRELTPDFGGSLTLIMGIANAHASGSLADAHAISVLGWASRPRGLPRLNRGQAPPCTKEPAPETRGGLFRLTEGEGYELFSSFGFVFGSTVSIVPVATVSSKNSSDSLSQPS